MKRGNNETFGNNTVKDENFSLKKSMTEHHDSKVSKERKSLKERKQWNHNNHIFCSNSTNKANSNFFDSDKASQNIEEIKKERQSKGKVISEITEKVSAEIEESKANQQKNKK